MELMAPCTIPTNVSCSSAAEKTNTNLISCDTFQINSLPKSLSDVVPSKISTIVEPSRYTLSAITDITNIPNIKIPAKNLLVGRAKGAGQTVFEKHKKN